MTALQDIDTFSAASLESVSDDDTVLINADTSPDDWYVMMGLRPALLSTMTDTIGAYFKSLLPESPEILGVYWCYEGETVRIWTAVEDMDFTVEAGIYDAQLKFIERMADIECDFSVIYRQGRDLERLLPSGLLPIA